MRRFLRRMAPDLIRGRVLVLALVAVLGGSAGAQWLPQTITPTLAPMASGLVGLAGASRQTLSTRETSGFPWRWNAWYLTSGSVFTLSCDDDTLGAGYYIRCLGGAAHETQVFGIGLQGAITTAGAMGMTLKNAAGGSANPFDYTATLGIMDNSDDFTLFDVNITNADHTGSSNTVQVLDIAAITGDAHATETAIKIGSGWDAGLTTASPITCSSTVSLTQVNAASGSANPWDYTGTLGVMNGTDDFTLFDVNLTNADHTSTTNTVQVLDVAAITGDADCVETAIKIGSGWDAGLTTASPISCTSTLDVTGVTTLASTASKRPIATAISGASATLTVASYPSGSVIECTAATVAITLPALTSGVHYTLIMEGATSFTLTGPSACVTCDGQTAAKTNLVWSTTPLYLSVNVVSTAASWIVTSFTTAPDSSS